jgi:hypothetical protein
LIQIPSLQNNVAIAENKTLRKGTKVIEVIYAGSYPFSGTLGDTLHRDNLAIFSTALA